MTSTFSDLEVPVNTLRVTQDGSVLCYSGLTNRSSLSPIGVYRKCVSVQQVPSTHQKSSRRPHSRPLGDVVASSELLAFSTTPATDTLDKYLMRQETKLISDDFKSKCNVHKQQHTPQKLEMIDNPENEPLSLGQDSSDEDKPTRSQTPSTAPIPKHTSPVGLTTRDMIVGTAYQPFKLQGMHRSKPIYRIFECNEDPVFNQAQNKNCYSSEVSKLVKDKYYLRSKSARMSTSKPITAGITKLKEESRPATTDGRSVTFELTITSIEIANTAEAYAPTETCDTNASDDMLDCQNDSEEKDTTHNDIPKPETKIDNLGKDNSSFRSRSAPPMAGRTVSSDLLVYDKGKKYSNMYWRTRSAFHKQQPESPNDRRPDELPNLKGSLLRPLMYADTVRGMKHSAGCPYRCRGCFKVLLASKNYPNVIRGRQHSNSFIPRAKGADKWNTRIPIPGQRKPDPIAIVNRALCRAQPLFRQVHGDLEKEIKVKHWPQHQQAWVDVKQATTAALIV